MHGVIQSVGIVRVYMRVMRTPETQTRNPVGVQHEAFHQDFQLF